MRKRTGFSLLAVVLVLSALAAALYLHFKAPPEVARLLPECDAIVYLDVKLLRTALTLKPHEHAPEYQRFIDATGIDFERDLDRVAFALNGMTDPDGPNGPVAFSEVFEGRFDGERLTRYLASNAIRQESYAGHTIYDIPSENRTLRVALLGFDQVAASNAPTAEQIHSVLDRSRSGANPFAGSSLLNARYAEVPLLGHQVWAIGRLGLPFARGGRISLLGLELPIPAQSTFVASLYQTTALHLRIDQIAANDAEAAQTVARLNSLLTLLRNLRHLEQPATPLGESADLQSLIDSIVIKQQKDRATLTATVPDGALRRFNR